MADTIRPGGAHPRARATDSASTAGALSAGSGTTSGSGDHGAGATRRFTGFDGYRAIAALAVLVLHASFITGFAYRHRVGAFLSRLDVGVTVFFLISGFLLFRPFVVAHLAGDAPPRLAPYLARRALRILPLYWLVLTIHVFVLHANVEGPGLHGIHGIQDAAVFYGLGQIYSRQYALGGVQQAWTLCVEASFYLFLPLWAAAIRRLPGARTRPVAIHAGALVALAGVGIGFRWFVLTHPVALDPRIHWLPASFDLFALGMGLAVLSAWSDQQARTFGTRPAVVARIGRMAGWWWALAGLAFVAVSTTIGLPRGLEAVTPAQVMAREGLFAVVALCILIPGVCDEGPSRIRRLLASRSIVGLGLVSYGIYLWHEGVLFEFRKWRSYPAFSGHAAEVLIATLTITLVAATITFHGVEKPFLRLKPRRR